MGIPYAEVIGDPIAHSKSPAIHKFWLGKLGIEGDYRAVQVRPDTLTDYLAARRTDPQWRGCNVTMPLKMSVADHVDHMTERAGRAGSINCITIADRKTVGTNTDIAGIEAAIDPHQIYRSACIIGAGGAARAAVAAFGFRGIRDLRILVRDPRRLEVGVPMAPQPPKIFRFAQAAQAIEDAEIIINATPLGMTGQAAMPLEVIQALSKACPDAHVVEMVYVPVDTPLLKRAAALGFSAADGFDVLIGQATEAFRLFFGAPAPRQYDARLRALLTS